VRVESVPNARPLAEREAHGCTALSQAFAPLRQLLGRHAVFLRQVGNRVFTLGGHGGVEFERLEMHLDLHAVAQARERDFKRMQADGAPWAGHVGDEIDLHSGPRQLLGRPS
jgi:hypothetical protein